MWRKIPLIGIVVLLWWISFAPEPVQFRYRNITNCALAILLFISIIAQKGHLRRLLLEKQDILLWVYLLIVVICGIFFAKKRLIALDWFYRVILPGPFLYLLIKNEINKVNGLVIARSLCIFGTMVALLGIAEFIFRKNTIYEYLVFNPYYYRYLHRWRIMSTQMHPAVLGTYFVACLPWLFLLISKTKAFLKRNFYYLCTLLIIIGLILTFSRGALMAAAFLSVAYLWRKNKHWAIRLSVSVLVLLFLLVLFSGGHTLIKKRFSPESLKNGVNYRLERYPATFRMFRDHPFVGLGLNNYRLFFDKYYGSSVIPYEWKIPDNMYLSILAETGITGFSAFIVFIVFLLKKAFRCFRSIKDKDTKELLITIIAGIIGLMVNFLTYDALYWMTPLFLFWIFAGMVSGLIGRGDYGPHSKYA